MPVIIQRQRSSVQYKALARNREFMARIDFALLFFLEKAFHCDLHGWVAGRCWECNAPAVEIGDNLSQDITKTGPNQVMKLI